MPRYIDAEIVKKIILEEGLYCDTESDKRYSASKIDEIPTADVVERKTGKWITMSDADGVYWSCSECGEDIPRIAHYNPQFDLFPRLETIDKTNFCPHCGARMEIE